jgi:hypothetical protein
VEATEATEAVQVEVPVALQVQEMVAVWAEVRAALEEVSMATERRRQRRNARTMSPRRLKPGRRAPSSNSRWCQSSRSRRTVCP